MSHTCKNYNTDNGDTTVIGGKLVFEDGAEVSNLPVAAADTVGGVKQGVAVADAASTAPTAAEFKALLDSLRGAGIIATAEPQSPPAG